MADRIIGKKRPPGKWPDRTEAERFWEKVEKGPTPDDCWLWTAATDSRGYGLFKAADGKMIRAHRWSYQEMVGPIAEPHMDHRATCLKRCIHPAHVTPRTRADHALQPDSLGGIQVAKTHCKQGHEFTPENTYLYTNTSGGRGRACRECHRQVYHKRKAGP